MYRYIAMAAMSLSLSTPAIGQTANHSPTTEDQVLQLQASPLRIAQEQSVQVQAPQQQIPGQLQAPQAQVLQMRPEARVVQMQAPAQVLQMPTPQESMNLQQLQNMKAAAATPPATARPRIVLALGGGGCKATAEIGVLRMFEKHHVPIDGIVGTSAGASIGALYAAGVPLDEIERLFLDGTMQHALQPSIASAVVGHTVRAALNKQHGGLAEATRLTKLLKAYLPNRFENLKIPFAAVTTDLVDAQTCMIVSGDLVKSVVASNTVPGVFRPVEAGRKLLVDGGVKSNVAIQCARALGGDVVVGISVEQQSSMDPKRFKRLRNVVMRATDTIIGEAEKLQFGHATIVVCPLVNDVPILTSKPELILKAVSAGEAAGAAALPKIKFEQQVAATPGASQ